MIFSAGQWRRQAQSICCTSSLPSFDVGLIPEHGVWKWLHAKTWVMFCLSQLLELGQFFGSSQFTKQIVKL